MSLLTDEQWEIERVRLALDGSGRSEMADELRCLGTGNLCGTDTRPKGRPCRCVPCIVWLENEAAALRADRDALAGQLAQAPTREMLLTMNEQLRETRVSLMEWDALIKRQEQRIAALEAQLILLRDAAYPFISPCRDTHEHPPSEVIEMIAEDPSILWPLRDALAKLSPEEWKAITEQVQSAVLRAREAQRRLGEKGSAR